jgi:branched-chain amino acid transport system ATP-binding protein
VSNGTRTEDHGDEPPGLAVSGLCGGYNHLTVLHDLDLRVGCGEVVAVLGPNGAGKSTMLLTIAGVLRPHAGAIHLFGDDVGGASVQARARRGLRFVPAGRGLFPGLTVKENIRVSSRDRDAIGRVVELAPTLAGLLDRRVGLLSGGEQQMLALAVVLVARPRMVLIDEMSTGLAPLVVQSMLPVLRSAADRDGAGVLMVEQHATAALEVSDRVVVLNQGRVVHEAPSAAVAERPELLTELYLTHRSGPDGPHH